jgi:SecD/SecF fusion protein
VSSRRSNLILVGLIVLALVGVALLSVPSSPFHRGVKKGLDLQGGLEVVLKAEPPKGHKLEKADLDRSVDIMRNRVDKLGVASPEIREQLPDQIVIQLAGIHDPEQAARIIGKTAELELYDLTPALVPPSVTARLDSAVPYRNLYNLLSAVQSKATGTPSGYVLFKPVKVTTGTGTKKKTKTVFVIASKSGGDSGTFATLHRDPSTGNAGLLDSHGGKVPPGWKVLKVPAKTIVVSCSKDTSSVCPGDGSGVPPEGKFDFYLFKHGAYPGDQYATDGKYPNMTGKDLKLSGVRQDFDPNGQPIVLLAFTGHGDKVFKQVTQNEATRGQISGVPGNQCGNTCAFAIVLDNEIRSFPTIDFDQNPRGIDPRGTGAEINNIGSTSEAKQLALVLQTGALPVQFKTLERTDVSATLGKDSLKEAQRAAIGGLIVVALFLLLLYRFLGIVAVIGLGIYAAFMYAAILLFGVTLTLPGFAGLILTIGVAADANVVIFERIKEESRAGKSVRAAIAAGYQKGFHTIVDANVVTCITALILFAVATAEVKGFALMLLIGTVISLITAVAATRAMLGLLAGFRWFEDPRFMGATATEIPRWQRIDVVGRRRLWFIISVVAVVLSVGAIAVKGLNLGIDFKGGVQIGFTTAKPTLLSDVRKEIPQKGAVVQGRGSSTNNGNSYKSFQIRLEKLNTSQQTNLQNTLVTTLQAEKLQTKNVSASFSRQILRGAISAIIISFALIALYVTIRYRWRFAVPILRTLLNDIPIMMGIYAISGREVTASTVAAILTILGYSVYDTIIVFDRIRENMRLMPRASIATIANVSVWEVLRRSIVTSCITILPIVALFIFGGATLKDFAFAIVVGIVIGAVSTILIATPLLTSLMEGDAEWARRKQYDIKPEQAAAVLRGAELAAAEEPAPETPVDFVETVLDGNGDDAAKRERRRQRRRSRPHGRAR